MLKPFWLKPFRLRGPSRAVVYSLNLDRLHSPTIASKRFSCIGYAIQLSKRIGSTKAVRSHLNLAMICLKDSADDAARPQESGPGMQSGERSSIYPLDWGGLKPLCTTLLAKRMGITLTSRGYTSFS